MRLITMTIFTAVLLCTSAATARADNGWTAERVRARFKHEPGLRELQKASLKFFMVNPRRVQSMRRRASNKAWLPTIQAGFQGDFMKFTRALEIAQYRAAYTFPWEDETQVDTRYRIMATATWNLPLLVFNAEELDVISLVGIQDGVLKEVTRLYFIRRRLQINLLLNPPRDVMTRLMLDLRLQELTGLLDAMTNGYLSRALRRNKARRAERKRGRTRRNPAIKAFLPAVKQKMVIPSAKRTPSMPKFKRTKPPVGKSAAKNVADQGHLQ